MELLWWVIVGIIAGFLTGKIYEWKRIRRPPRYDSRDRGRHRRRISGPATWVRVFGGLAVHDPDCGAWGDAGDVHRTKDSRTQELKAEVARGVNDPRV